VVKYEGTGSARTVAHSLGTTVGMIIVKNLDQSDNWAVYHRGDNGGSSPDNFYMSLNLTDASNNSATRWNDTAPTSSVFTVGTDHSVNASGENYVAYLFAHNNDDGGFGEPGDQDIIKCGTYTGNGSTQSIALGFEPQFVLLKNTGNGTGSSSNWVMFDNMRGVVTSSSAADDKYLFPNLSTSEGGGIPMNFTATGFDLANEDTSNKNTDAFIYMAIRRGGMQTPTAASSVFAIDTMGSTGDGNAPSFRSTFPVDMAMRVDTGVANNEIAARLMGSKWLYTNTTDAEANLNQNKFDYQNGWMTFTSTASNYHSYMWKRAPSYLDVVAYTGTGTAGLTVNHNLGVAPEMTWVKRRDSATNWRVNVAALGTDGQDSPSLRLNLNNAAEDDNGSYFGNNNSGGYSAPTSSVLTFGGHGDVNASGGSYIAYLFATVAGVSKIGTYTGNDGTTNVDCGFTNGASFVLIKKTNGNNNWFVFDSTRGMGTGNTPSLKLDTTEAEDDLGARDIIDPLAAGFTVNANRGGVNDNGDTFIFYAIAAIS